MGLRGCNRYDTRLGRTRLIKLSNVPPPSGEHQNLVRELPLPTGGCSSFWWGDRGRHPEIKSKKKHPRRVPAPNTEPVRPDGAYDDGMGHLAAYEGRGKKLPCLASGL